MTEEQGLFFVSSWKCAYGKCREEDDDDFFYELLAEMRLP